MRHHYPSTRTALILSGGPVTVSEEAGDGERKTHPVGFTAPLKVAGEIEPLVWHDEGDNA